MTSFEVKLCKDIYYQTEYSSLYATNESELFEFEYQEADKKISFRSIKRKIEDVAGVAIKEELYDLETPYGYGGPLTNCYETEFIENAFSAYRKECIAQNIVSEFIRFHPFNPISKFCDLFDFHVQERQVVVVDLTLTTEERWTKYSKTTRNILRKANKKLQRRKDNAALDNFYSLYELTMDKNNASDFYYFQTEYFNKLSEVNGVELLNVELENSIVSAGFFMHGKELAHYHLSANHIDFLRENGNYALLDFAFENAKAQGCSWMMLGGGRTSDENDSLFKFKAKFSDLILPFYIGGLTFLPDIRNKLNTIWQNENKDSKLNLFQLYRM